MNSRIAARLMALDRRVLLGLVAVAGLFLSLEAWLLVLRAPVAESRALAAARRVGEAAPGPGALAAEVARLGLAVSRAEQELRNALPTRSEDDMVMFLIGTLDRTAIEHAVALGTVKPLGRRVDRGYESTSFEVEARGGYLALIEWLRAAEVQVAPLTVGDLSLSAVDEGRQVALKVNLVAHAIVPEPPGGTP